MSTVPPHVSPDRVYDFDIYADKRFGSEMHTSLDVLHREAPDVFYTPRNGGHWIVTRRDQIAEVVQDPENFSAREMQIPRISEPPVFLPLNLDPPANLPYRQALMPSFSPKAVRELEGRIRFWAHKLVDNVAAKGECDFVHDISAIYPVSIFMELMGMDLDRLWEFRELAENYFGSLDDEPNLIKYNNQIIEIMTEYIREKQKNPDDGVISRLTQAQIDGRPISLEELQNMCTLLFQGGLHTVTNLTAFTYWQLAKDPALQERLRNDPELIPKFVEEGVRMFGVINTPRLVARDCEKFGVRFREGEMVLCMLPLAGRDERVNPDATRFDIDRKNGQLLTFSQGPHLCLGHFLARAEMRILTEEWVKRIPAFSLKPGAKQVYTTGTVCGLVSMPLVWEPA